MKYHIALPNGDPSAEIQPLIEIAEATEALGFAGVMPLDHLLMPRGGPYTRIYEPLVTLAYIAARTSRISLGTSVIVIGMRNPFVVAKQAATLDILSGGRLLLGVGAGYAEGEFANVGADFRTRGARTDESIRLFRHLFSGSGEPFEGRFYDYRDGIFDPLPVQGKNVPILIGGNSDAALRRAATLGDIWQSTGLGPEQFASRLTALRALAGDRRVEAGARVPMAGSVDEMAEKVASWRAAGAEHLLLNFGKAHGFLKSMRTFSEGVLTAL